MGKPKLVKGYYIFKDAAGQTNYVATSRVRMIQTQPRGQAEEPIFTPPKR